MLGLPARRLGRVGPDRSAIPESELNGLEAELRSISQGLASYEAEFDHLAELNGTLAEKVIQIGARAGLGGRNIRATGCRRCNRGADRVHHLSGRTKHWFRDTLSVPAEKHGYLAASRVVSPPPGLRRSRSLPASRSGDVRDAV